MMQEQPQKRISKLLSAAGLLLIFILSATFAQAQGLVVRPVSTSSANLMLVIDGKVVDADVIELQRGWQVMVWLRDIENLGWGKIEPGSKSGQVSLKGEKATLTFTKNEGVAMVNSLQVRLPIDTYMSGDHLMVPLSFVAKALGYEYDCSTKTVATISTSGPIIVEKKASNSIEGKVTYNYRGVGNVLVRAVTKDFTVIGNVSATTDADGSYKLQSLPDGECMAYVYCGDNPKYFNRASEVVNVKGGEATQVATISLGHIITPLRPKPSERVSLGKSNLEMAWISCEGADTYKLILRKTGSSAPVFEAVCRKPGFSVPASKLSVGNAYEVEITALNSAGDYLGGTAGPGGKPWSFFVIK